VNDTLGRMKLPSWLAGGKSKEAEAIKEYNLGFEAKYRGDWRTSLEHNQKAAALNGDDQATWWNIGIAATALSDWPEARRAWTKCGITDLGTGTGEILWASCTSCVRLNPNESREVVWGTRIDPARIRVDNVPLASSDRLYGDILIHDGAQEGTRISGKNKFPVFNELGVWQRSAYSTYKVELISPNTTAPESLEERCRENDMWLED
jgi:hypothetical protein